MTKNQILIEIAKLWEEQKEYFGENKFNNHNSKYEEITKKIKVLSDEYMLIEDRIVR